MDEVIVDMNDNVIVVGDRIVVESYEGEKFFGTITTITDLDGDVDDEGRAIIYTPQVTVKFDDGVEEKYSTCHQWQDSSFQCDELEKEV